MSDVVQEGAPAVASDDPANLSGPGVTQNPPNADAVFDVAAIAQENARLRADLIAENDRLKAALADSQASGLAAQGLSDEDVRRIEHPEEYADEYASLGEHQALKLTLQSLSERLDAAHMLIADARAERAQLAQNARPADPSQGGVGRTADPVVDPSQVSTPVDPTVPDSSVVHGGEPSVIGDANASRDLSSLSDGELFAELSRREAKEGD